MMLFDVDAEMMGVVDCPLSFFFSSLDACAKLLEFACEIPLVYGLALLSVFLLMSQSWVLVPILLARKYVTCALHSLLLLHSHSAVPAVISTLPGLLF